MHYLFIFVILSGRNRYIAVNLPLRYITCRTHYCALVQGAPNKRITE